MTEHTAIKRTRRTPEQMAAARAVGEEKPLAQDKGRSERPEIRQRAQKPLKLEVSGIIKKLEEEQGKKLKFKFCDLDELDYQLENNWEVVKNNSSRSKHNYSPDGRVLEDTNHKDDGGAYTAKVGTNSEGQPRYNFLIYKDLETYNREDALWDKDQADQPMSMMNDAVEMGERAGLGGNTYQPND